MPIHTVEQLQALFRAQGVDAVYIKRLAPRQDNEKNQIYFGVSFDSISNLFPAKYSLREPSKSTAKKSSKAGQHILEATVDLAWLGENGQRHPAPNSRIIHYFQYPEIRFSGFLDDCENPPDALRRDRQGLYGLRLLALGVARDGVVVGRVLTERDDPVVVGFPDLPALPGSGIFRVLTVDAAAGRSPRSMINAAIREVVAAGWHLSSIMKGDAIEPFRGPQGAGYTLEALLGVPANAKKDPDKYGYELKAFSGSRVTLMTPTPDRGFQGEHTFRQFMEAYGRPAKKDDGSLRFTGTHKCGSGPCDASGLALRVAGYDPDADTFAEDASKVAVELYDPTSGVVAASWSLEKLANSWNKKHAFALYLRYEKNPAPTDPARDEYRYLAPWLVGEGTDVWRLLRAIARGHIFYDPADTIYADDRAKVRPQWRVNTSNFEDMMRTLYAEVIVVEE